MASHPRINPTQFYSRRGFILIRPLDTRRQEERLLYRQLALTIPRNGIPLRLSFASRAVPWGGSAIRAFRAGGHNLPLPREPRGPRAAWRRFASPPI